MNKESQNIEWKQSWQDEYLKWICGFANAQGGRGMKVFDRESHEWTRTEPMASWTLRTHGNEVAVFINRKPGIISWRCTG